MSATTPRVSISVVSHGQAELVANMLRDLDEHCSTDFEVLLTVNIPETLPFSSTQFRFPVRVIENAAPKGFGANHNAAFALCRESIFCVLNPDIRLRSDPFPALVNRLDDPRVGLVAPLVRSPAGAIEDNARPFPTPLFILRKALFGAPAPVYQAGAPDFSPDWVGGMFMLFRRETFAAVQGFDECFHLYYEDVDLCARVRLAGNEIVFCPRVEVVHDARRESHRKLRYLGWHLASMIRFFTSWPFVRLVILGRRPSSDLPAPRR
jgi:hypothetical protein